MAIMRWIERTAETLPAKGYEQAFGVWSGTDFLPILDKEFGVNESTLQTYKVQYTWSKSCDVAGVSLIPGLHCCRLG